MQSILSGIVGARARELQDLLRVATRTTWIDLRLGHVGIDRVSDVELAVTFAAAMQGAMDGRSLLGHRQVPTLILAVFYTGAQEDAVEVLTGCLAGCPMVAAQFSGRARAAQLLCARCGGWQSSGAAEDERVLNRLMIGTRSGEARVFEDVQSAVDVCMEEELPSDCHPRWCQRCQRLERFDRQDRPVERLSLIHI